MRRLMLMRHAKSDWSLGGQPDVERTLAPRGREIAPLVGRYIAQHALRPDQAMVSTARRARETWDLLAPKLGKTPPVVFDKRLYETPAKNILAALQEARPDVHTLLVIGHNPGMQELASLLMATGDIAARQNLLEKFPTAGLAVIDFAIDRWSDLKAHAGRLDRFVTPRALALSSD